MTIEFSSPAGYRQGAYRCPDGSVQWTLWAPKLESLSVAIWQQDKQTEHPMTAVGNGFYRFQMQGVSEGTRYAYRLPDGRLLPDPATRWQPEGVHAPSALFFPEDFEWTDRTWRGPPLGQFAIYEMHVGTFTPEGTFDAVIGRLGELVDLGVTAIEIMPVSQFPGERNWGYDGVCPYAAQSTYGGPRALQRLVDAAHRAGLAVLLDVVYNHFGPEGNYLSEFGHYFTEHHRTPWGGAINYDGADCEPVRRFAVDNACQWVRDFHMDGLRLDAVQTIYDLGAVHVLSEIQQGVQQVARQQQRQVYVIAETNQNDRRLLDPVDRNGYGLDGVWADDLHHAVHSLLTGEREGYYFDFGSAKHLAKAFETPFVYDGCYSPFRRRRHGNSAAGLARERFVVCIQNHDQVGNRMHGDRFGSLLSPERQRLAAALLLVSPYTPMLFMGEEYGEDAPFPFFCSFGDESLIEAVRKGRREEFAACDFEWEGEPPDPHDPATFDSAKLTWSWPEDSHRAGLRNLYRDLLADRRALSVFRQHTVPRVHLLGETPDGDSRLLRLEYDAGLVVVANLTDAEQTWEPPAVPRLRSTADAAYGGPRNEATPDDRLLPFELQLFAPKEAIV